MFQDIHGTLLIIHMEDTRIGLWNYKHYLKK